MQTAAKNSLFLTIYGEIYGCGSCYKFYKKRPHEGDPFEGPAAAAGEIRAGEGLNEEG